MEQNYEVKTLHGEACMTTSYMCDDCLKKKEQEVLSESMKNVLDLGFSIESDTGFKINRTKWGTLKSYEYALHYPSGKTEYFYDDKSGDDYSYKEGFKIFMQSVNLTV